MQLGKLARLRIAAEMDRGADAEAERRDHHQRERESAREWLAGPEPQQDGRDEGC